MITPVQCYHILLICSSISGHLGCSHILAVVNNATLSISVQVSLRDPAFNYFEYISTHIGYIDILLYHIVILFLFFLRQCPTAFYSGCISLHFYYQCKRVPISPHPGQYIYIFLAAFLMGVW